MPQKTKIQWADYVSNPIRAEYETEPMPMLGGHRVGRAGWACVRVSPGCEHCWASTFNVRLGTSLAYTAQNMKKVNTYLDEIELRRMGMLKPRGPFKNGRARPIAFVCDMTDLFGEWVSDEQIDRVFEQMYANHYVDWVVLTKRAGRMAQYCKDKSLKNKKPLSNIYLGCTAEDQQRAELRMNAMRYISALGWKTVASYEPALSNVDWSDWMFLDWLICGGESGSGARPMHPDWARNARDFCARNFIPFFFKQWGEYAPLDHLPWLTDATTFKHKPVSFEGTTLCRVGKGLAGHVLDGREWVEVAR